MKKIACLTVFWLLASASVFGAALLEDDLRLNLVRKGVKDFGIEGLTLVFYVEIANVSGRDYYLSGYSYRFLVNQMDYIRLQTDLEEGIRIGPREKTQVAFPVKITYRNLFQTLPRMREEHQAACSLIGWARFSDGRRERGRLPLAFTGEFPVFRKPELASVSIHIKTLTIGGADLDVKLRFRNQNQFELFVDRLSYALVLGGRPLAEGTISGDKNISKDGEKTFLIPLLLNFFEVGREMAGLLRQPSVPCRLSGELDIQTVWGRVTIPYEKEEKVPVVGNE